MVWDFVIMMTVIYITTINPIRIAFIDFDSNSQLMWLISDIISDSLLLIDIVLNFFVIEEDALGVPIITFKGIAKHYIKTYFVFDFLSAIPASTIVRVVQISLKN